MLQLVKVMIVWISLILKRVVLVLKLQMFREHVVVAGRPMSLDTFSVHV